MSARELMILGTACQVPTAKRNHNGYFVKWDEEGFLIDPGEGTQRQMVLMGISSSQITKIFISHFHGDHCLGLAGVVQRLSLDGVQHPVTVFYPESGEAYFRRLIQAAIFYPRHKLNPIPVRKSGVVYENQKLKIVAQFLEHTVDCLGFRIQEKDSQNLMPDKLEAAGITGKLIAELKSHGKIIINGETFLLEDFVVNKKGNSFTYIADTQFCSQAIELAKDCDVLLCESTYLTDREKMAKAFGHLTARQAGELAKRASVKRLYLTHFSQIYTDSKEFAREASLEFSGAIAVEDLQKFELPREKRKISRSR